MRNTIFFPRNCVFGVNISSFHHLFFTHVQVHVLHDFAHRVRTPTDSLSEFARGFGQPVPSAPLLLPRNNFHNSVVAFPRFPVRMAGSLLTGVHEALTACKQAEWVHLGASPKPTMQPPPKDLYIRTQSGVLRNYLQQQFSLQRFFRFETEKTQQENLKQQHAKKAETPKPEYYYEAPGKQKRGNFFSSSSNRNLRNQLVFQMRWSDAILPLDYPSEEKTGVSPHLH